MNNNSELVLPLELVDEWSDMLEYRSDLDVFTMAAQWGADQELDACVQWLRKNEDAYDLTALRAVYLDLELRAARRPAEITQAFITGKLGVDLDTFEEDQERKRDAATAT